MLLVVLLFEVGGEGELIVKVSLREVDGTLSMGGFVGVMFLFELYHVH